MTKARTPKATDSVTTSQPNSTRVHLHRGKPEVINSGGLHSIEATSKTYGMKPAAPIATDHPARKKRTVALHHAASTPTGYTCPELGRNPGMHPARFAAYALPSRVGNCLHYPDGRVEEVAA